MRLSNQQFNEAKGLRQELRLPVKLCEMLDFQEETIKKILDLKQPQFNICPCGSSKSKKKFEIDQEFMEFFKKMSSKQQIVFYHKYVSYLSEISKGLTQSNISIENKQFQNVLIKSGFRYLPHSLRVDAKQGIMFIFGPKSQIINLRQYLLRISSDNKINCFILSSIKSNFKKTLRLVFDQRQQFEICYSYIQKVLDVFLFERLKNQLIQASNLPSSQMRSHLRFASQQRNPNIKQMSKQIFQCKSQVFILPTLDCQLNVSEFKKKYRLLNQKYDPKQLFPSDYNQEKLNNNGNFRPISHSNSFLKQLKDDPLIFKLQKLLDVPIHRIIETFSNVSSYPKWNTQLISSNLLSIITNQNSLLINQIHKSALSIFQPASFTYLRTLHTRNNKTYIIDRSIIPQSTSQYRNCNIVFSVWKLVPMKNYTLLQGTIKLDYKLQNYSDAQIQLTKRYIQNFSNLEHYLKNNYNKQTKKLFDMNYNQMNYVKLINDLQGKVVRVEDDGNNNNKENVIESKKPNKIKRISVNQSDDDSFYTAQGASDWNSKILSISRISKAKNGSLVSVRSLKRILSRQFLQPIKQVPSIIKENQRQSLIDKKSKLSKTQSNQLIRQFSLGVLPKASVKSFSKQDIYKQHITQIVTINLDSKGSVIVPQNYISRLTPMPPQDKYPYQKMTGDDWNHYFCKGDWQILSNGQLRFKNLQKLKFQNGVLSKVLKKVATNLISGKGFNVSLPVQVFSELSIFELTGRGMCFAPLFLERAAKESRRLEKMKLAICFALGFSISYLEMAKPFNPILGQTYQAWINGCPFYCEQTSHHPPISSYLMIGRGYKVYGNLTPEMNLSMNSGVGYNSGETVIVFDNDPNYEIYLRSPGGQIQGLTYGDRKFNLSGKGFCYDNLNSYCQILYNCDKKSMFSFSKQSKPVDSFQGHIYEVDRSQIQQFRAKFKREGISKKLLTKPLTHISGRYTQKLLFDDVLYFDPMKDEPCMLQQQKYPLASNCNYREDIVYKRKNDNTRAQSQKQRLENIQRNDRKLRGNNH